MSFQLAILRHCPTLWNEQNRYMGRTDLPLSLDGEMAARAQRLPAPYDSWPMITSPLLRARQTGAFLRGDLDVLTANIPTDTRLIERDLGVWEGLSYHEVRPLLHAVPGNIDGWVGLDYRPEGGESLREVQDRLTDWLKERAKDRENTVVVAHKIVLFALYGLATGWDGARPPQDKLRSGCFHLFQVDEDGALRLEKLNLPLLKTGAKND